MALEFNPNLYPPGGYVFKERDGTILRGDSWRTLEARIKDFREVNGIPVGDVHDDVMVQMCQTYPHLCGIVDNTPVPPEGRVVSMTHTQRVIQWFINLLNLKRAGKIPRVDDQTAAARAIICQRCPRQAPLSQACGACLRTIEDSKKAALDGATSLHQNLLTCGVLAEDPSITVHIEQVPSDNRELPAECWRRRR